MWKSFAFIPIGLILIGCASGPEIKPHRPSYYEKEKIMTGEAVLIMIAASIVGISFPGAGLFVTGAAENYRMEKKALAVYPECQGSFDAELWKCVREIDIQEGRVPPDYVDIQRADMDELHRGNY